MNLGRTLAVARKETLHIIRDWRSLVLIFFLPSFLLILYGFALTFDVKNVPLIVWDQSQTPDSRDFISQFEGSSYFSLKGYVDNYDEINKAINTRKAFIGMIIPYDFSRKIESSRPASVQVIVDGTDANTATISLNYIDAIERTYRNKLAIKRAFLYGKEKPNQLINVKSRIWFNPNSESNYTIIPGLIAVIMMVIAALMTSLTIAREWEKGTMEQLISTPIQGSEIIFGKMLPYFFIGIVDMMMIYLMGKYLFEVPFLGSFLFFFIISSIFLIGTLSFGLLISVATKNQLVASQIAMISTFLPSFLISGFFTTLSNTPLAIQVASYFVPAKYFITLLRSIYLKGSGLVDLYWEAALLTIFSICLTILVNKKFKKKMT